MSGPGRRPRAAIEDSGDQAAAAARPDPEALRDQLPGLEAERDLDDWGHSRRLEEALDRTLWEFLYRYWFRAGVQGIDNVPGDRGALLVCNRAGALAADAAMVAKAIRCEHPCAPALHLAVHAALIASPAIGTLAARVGAVASHPANLQRLLFDEQALVLAFPEGRGGAGKPLHERYRLAPFDALAFVPAAIRARAPIVPVAVLGAEEALPTIGLPKIRRRLPLTAGLPLPARFAIRFLEPVSTDALPARAACDPALVGELTERIRALIQENVLELLARRRSIWLG